MKIETNPQKIENVLTRRVVEVLPNKEELKKIMRKRRIRLYLGIDPTGSKLHLGHTITLRKLQEFADLGHEAILIIGTGTVLAGDPSQRETARPLITEKEVEKNIKNWKKQVGKILDFKKVKIRYNGEWLLKLDLPKIIKIASHISAAKLFQREMFQKRIKKGETVWTHEFLYPLLQGYDSVALKTDLEIGGTDQVFNMLIGRELVYKMLKKEKFVLTCPMILGTDGKQMSKTSGNCIWLEDTPEEMFGKIMSIPDELIISYFETLTDVPQDKINIYKKELQEKKVNPVQIKKELAFEIVKIYHSLELAKLAKENFERIFKQKKTPLKIPIIKISKKEIPLIELLMETKLFPSKSEAKRLIVQKGVKIDGKIKEKWKEIIKIKKEMVLQLGKRKFVKIK